VRRLSAFGRFWWDFVVGDDWLAAVGVVLAIGATAALAHDGVTAWWLLPLAVLLVLYVSLRRATR
jgi:hypothetical protein